MGHRSKSIERPLSKRLRGYQVVQHLEFVELIPSRWNSAWPKLANRFEVLGVLLRLSNRGGQPRIFVAAEAAIIEAMLVGRSARKKFPRLGIIGLALPVILALSMVPFGAKPRVEQIASMQKPAIQTCSRETIGKWLQGLGESAEISLFGASVLGGVTVGILECRGSRYRYTLGSEEPKRVLKLEKLNS